MNDDARARRLAANEALFRHANEALRKADDSVVSIAGFLCECADPDCEERIEVPGDTYLRVRQSPVQFIIMPGHADPSIERVIEEIDGFLVIEKLGAGRDVAERLAPRQTPADG